MGNFNKEWRHIEKLMMKSSWLSFTYSSYQIICFQIQLYIIIKIFLKLQS